MGACDECAERERVMGREVETWVEAVLLKPLQTRQRTLKLSPIVMGSQRKSLLSYPYFL